MHLNFGLQPVSLSMRNEQRTMKKILIIDDDHVICEMLNYLLEHRGYEVFIATQFSDLFANEKLSTIDIILLDKRLGHLDGTVLCKKLKNNKETAEVPVIMMSGLDKARKDCMLAGADDFINKPFEITQLFSTIEQFTNVKL